MHSLLIGVTILMAGAGDDPRRTPADRFSAIRVQNAIQQPILRPQNDVASLQRRLVRAQRPPLTVSYPRANRGSMVFLGIIAGTLAGAFIGHELTRDCTCDTPGGGAFIGMPIGAAAGGVIAFRLTK